VLERLKRKPRLGAGGENGELRCNKTFFPSSSQSNPKEAWKSLKCSSIPSFFSVADTICQQTKHETKAFLIISLRWVEVEAFVDEKLVSQKRKLEDEGTINDFGWLEHEITHSKSLKIIEQCNRQLLSNEEIWTRDPP
jgi:hypothetical protein